MKIEYYTEPQEKYVSRIKTGDMKYARTSYTCPLCKGSILKREFEKHARTVHGSRYDEAFALLYGVPWPAKCSCGKDLHYNALKQGFPKNCGICNSLGYTANMQYKNAEDAHKHVEQLKAMLADAQSEEKRLAQEAELSRKPLNELPFPTKKNPIFLKRISIAIRMHAINGEKDKLIELANTLDACISKLE